MYLYGSSPTLTNVTFSNNTAKICDGGKPKFWNGE